MCNGCLNIRGKFLKKRQVHT